jgi:hypothetical protein
VTQNEHSRRSPREAVEGVSNLLAGYLLESNFFRACLTDRDTGAQVPEIPPPAAAHGVQAGVHRRHPHPSRRMSRAAWVREALLDGYEDVLSDV